MKEIRLFKLVNGEEVIGEVTEDNTFKKVIHKPRVVFELFTNDGPALTLRPYFKGAYDLNVVHIPQGHIIDTAKPTKRLEEAYVKETTSILLSKDA